MNEVRLTGTIVSDIDARSRPDGTESCSALLQFHKSNGPVLLFCLEERAHKLARFKSGDLVSVRGRLTINSLNAKAAILVDEVQHLDARKESAEDREASEWNATRRHQLNAQVKGNRWATRAGYVK
jgi:hypothetical protein